MYVGSQCVQVTISSAVTAGKKRARERGPVPWTASAVPAVLLVRLLACSSGIHGCFSISLYIIVSMPYSFLTCATCYWRILHRRISLTSKAMESKFYTTPRRLVVRESFLRFAHVVIEEMARRKR